MSNVRLTFVWVVVWMFAEVFLIVMNNSQHPLNPAQPINVFRAKQIHGEKWHVGFGNNRNSSSCMCLAHHIHGVCQIHGSARGNAHGKVQQWCRAVGACLKQPLPAPNNPQNPPLSLFSRQHHGLSGVFPLINLQHQGFFG